MVLSVYSIPASYGTISKIAHYQLKTKLTVPRPVNIKQEKYNYDYFIFIFPLIILVLVLIVLYTQFDNIKTKIANEIF